MSDIQFTRVTSVSVDAGKVFVSCQPPRPGVEYRNIPLLRLFPGAMVTPSEGDIVAVHKLPDGSKVATMASSLPEGVTMPNLGEGEMCFRFSDGTQIKISKDGSGTYNVNIDADGSVFINGIDFDQHTHDYQDGTINDTSDGTGTQTDTARTTGPPNP